MSSQAMSWAMRCTVGDPAAKFVLVILADWADEQFVVAPDWDAVRRVTELDEAGLQAALDRLVEARFVLQRLSGLPEDDGAAVYLLGVEFHDRPAGDRG